MTSVGETLRRERLRRNLALDQISRELKINPRMLEAIEAEEFDKLPGTIFAKNFVRQYAHLLGLDEEEMAGEVQRALQPSSEIPRFAGTGKPAPAPVQVAPIVLPKVEQWESVGDRGFSWGSPLPALALFVVAMLVCSGVYAWYQRTRHPVLARNPAVTAPADAIRASPSAAGGSAAASFATGSPAGANRGAVACRPGSGADYARSQYPGAEYGGAKYGGACGRPSPGSGSDRAHGPHHRTPPDHRRRAKLGAGADRWQVSVFRHHGGQSDPYRGGFQKP